MIKAVAFDFGNTLVDSRFPLSWQGFYHEAIIDILKCIELEINPDKIRSGEEIFLKYNTRVNPREHEVDSNTIFRELFEMWGINDFSKIKTAKDAFASFFQGQSELYADSLPTLKYLKKKGLKTGVLTNVAYGLDKEYIMLDITEVSQYIDVFLTSTEIGFRKPNPAGYKELAKRLGINITDCMFIGDEEVDVIGANRSGMISVLLDRNDINNQYGQAHTIGSLFEVKSLI
jgi:putative hydrolase of the HAD superfamily